MSVTVLNEDRQELTDLENAHEISYTKRINEAPTASFALPVDDEKDSFCKIGRLVRLEDEDGKIGLFRIDSTRLNTKSTQRYYDLFHVVDTLNDQMFPGKSTVNDGLTQLTESVEEGGTTLPVRDPGEFEAGETIIIAGRDTSEKVTVESIFDGGDTAKVKMEVRGSIGPISESNKDEDVLKDQKLNLDNSLKNSYGAGTTIAVPIALQDAIKEVLNEQETEHWQLGECNFSIDDLVFQFHDATLLDALFSIGEKIGQKYVWKWDTDTYPWTLHLKDPVETEPVGYIDRGVNLQDINLKRDPSKIATRLYPYGTDGISIKPVKGREYIQDDEAIKEWGVREKVVRTNHNTPSALLTAAENILDQRKEPESTFEINAADLARITDEDVHRYELGDWVKVSDSENGVEVKEILVSKSKNNLQENPAQISLEFASKTEFFETADEQLAGFRGDIDNEINETTSRFDEIRGNLLSDLEDIKGFVNESRKNIDNLREKMDGQNIYINQTKESLTTAIKNNEGDISALQQRADEIELAVANNDDDIGALQVRADEIELAVSDNEGNISDLQVEVDSIEATVTDHENRVSQLEIEVGEISTTVDNQGDTISQMKQTASEFSFTIYGEGDGTATMDGDDIISQINLSSSGVTIEGENVNITGDDIDITGDDITLNGNTTVEDDFNVDGNVWLKGGYATWPLTIPSSSIDNANFGVKSDGTVIAKDIKTLKGGNNDDVINEGKFQGAKIVKAGIVSERNTYQGSNPSDSFKETSIGYIDVKIPDGKMWVIQVTTMGELAIASDRWYDDRSQIADSKGIDYRFYGYFNESGAPRAKFGPEDSSTEVSIVHHARQAAGMESNNFWGTCYTYFEIIEVDQKWWR